MIVIEVSGNLHYAAVAPFVEEVETLITTRQVGPLQGFMSKKGFPFAALLKMNAIVGPGPIVTDANLGDWVEDGWNLNTPGAAPGDPQSFLPSHHLSYAELVRKTRNKPSTIPSNECMAIEGWKLISGKVR